jgi:hypothetical protein
MPDPQKKDDTSASTRALAVTNFTVPVTIAWLLAVGGILSWNRPAQALLDNAGQIVAALGVGIAFVTVILSAVQDVIPLQLKQWLLFPFGRPENALPSHWAFSDGLMKKANLDDFDGVAVLRKNPKAQHKRWSANYHVYRDRPGLVHFSTRHLAWIEMVPVLFLLLTLSLILRWSLGRPETIGLWHCLAGACAMILVLSWVAGRHSSTALIVAVLEQIRYDGDKSLAASDAPAPATA